MGLKPNAGSGRLVRDLFRQLGHPYLLTIERNDQTLHLTMKLKRLLPDNEG